MAVQWFSEAADVYTDEASGSLITRLTHGAMHSINVYMEQPCNTPDGRYIAVQRSANVDPRMPPFDLAIADLKTYRVAMVDKDCGGTLLGTSSYSGMVHYLRRNGELIRLDLATQRKQIVYEQWDIGAGFEFTIQSVTPDGRYLIGVEFLPGYRSAIVRIDLHKQTWEHIYEHPEVLTHLQINPANGRDILVQLNRGSGLDHQRRSRRVENPLVGATHFLIDINGKNERPLAIGEPHTSQTTGHSSWIGDTGRVVIACHWQDARVERAGALDARYPQGNMFHVGPGEARPTCIDAPEHRFNHCSASRCGKYWVSDSYPKNIPGPIPIVIGNFATGKHRTLVSDCKASCGNGAATHPHPYITGDNGHVVFNADVYHLGQVYKATIPPAFLASLD
jgi:hypothetical protein